MSQPTQEESERYWEMSEADMQVEVTIYKRKSEELEAQVERMKKQAECIRCDYYHDINKVFSVVKDIELGCPEGK